jgi:3-hydroxyisobutyrate dehydrogenase
MTAVPEGAEAAEAAEISEVADVPEAGVREVEPGAVVGFVGLGNMGFPMVRRLVEAGYAVRAYDARPEVRHRVERETGAVAVPSARDVAGRASAVVLMLPDSGIVRSVLEDDGLLAALAPGAVLVDMGSSEPARTRELAEQAARSGRAMVDAPVSGGTSGAQQGTLTIMAGGSAAAVAAVRPLLGVLGRRVLHVGPSGAGHALKALNNLLSATHLLVTSEAILAGQEFGLDPAVMLDAINGSSGRSGSTENKWPTFVLGRSFDSGFGLRLMLKDMRIAVGLCETVGRPSRLGAEAAELWGEAAELLPADADHTEIVRWLEGVPGEL